MIINSSHAHQVQAASVHCVNGGQVGAAVLEEHLKIGASHSKSCEFKRLEVVSLNYQRHPSVNVSPLSYFSQVTVEEEVVEQEFNQVLAILVETSAETLTPPNVVSASTVVLIVVPTSIVRDSSQVTLDSTVCSIPPFSLQMTGSQEELGVDHCSLTNLNC